MHLIDTFLKFWPLKLQIGQSCFLGIQHTNPVLIESRNESAVRLGAVFPFLAQLLNKVDTQ